MAESLDDGLRHVWQLGQDGEGGREGHATLLPGRYRVALEWTFVDDPPDYATQEGEVRADAATEVRFGGE